MPRGSLTPAQCAEFERSGCHFPVHVLDEAQALQLRRELEALEHREGGQLSKRTNRKPHLLLTSLAALVRHPAILDVVESLIGPDILCWGSDFFIKNPGDGKIVSWHQDSTYWGLSPPEIVTAWVALAPSTPESGCLRVVPGTHLRDQLPHHESYAENNLLSRGQEVAVEVDERSVLDVVLAPGEASIHHVRLVHGSNPNRSNDRRIGFAIRYMSTRVRQLQDGRDSATLVRGEDRYGHFALESAPAADFHPDAVAMHARVIDAQAEILFRGAKSKAWDDVRSKGEVQ